MQIATPLFLDPMPEPPGAIRSKTRTAIELMIMKPTSAAEAAREAGLRDDTLPTALAKPEVIAYVHALKDWKDRRDTAMRQGYLGEALDRARHIMLNSESEQMQMRAIVFLRDALAPKTDDGKPGPVLQLTQNIGPGYNYPSPPDQASLASDTQAIDHKAQSGD